MERTAEGPTAEEHDARLSRILDLGRRGLRRGKKVKGRKRHILLDTLGFLLSVIVHFADIQDRDGTFHLLRQARRLFPFIERFIADSATEAISRQLGLDRTRGSCL